MSKANCQKIHEASMKILARTGMKYNHPEAIRILKENGIKVEGNIAYFTEEQIMYWIKKAPHSFKLYARNPKYDITIGGDEVNYAPAYGSPYIASQDGSRRYSTMEDYVNFAKLYHTNHNFNVVGGVMCQPTDMAVENAALFMYYASYINSDKCMQVGAGDKEQMEALMAMVEACFGSKEELIQRPRIITIVDIITQLQLDYHMTDTLIKFAEYGQPFVAADCAMAGTTSPVTLGGTLAVGNAEILATIALAQMVREGTPVCYASQTTSACLKSGQIACGSPEGALCYKYTAEMAKFYGLPCRGGGALSDSKIMDPQAAYESMMSVLTCTENKMNFIIHAAGIVDGYSAVSYEKLVMDFQILDYVRRYERDIEIEEDTIPFDLIDEIGHCGTYLAEDHTLDFCFTEFVNPFLSSRGVVLDPVNQFENKVKQYMEKAYASFKRPENDDEILAKLRNIMLERGATQADIEKMEAL